MDNQLLAQIQAQYGSAQIGNMQALRYVYYSKQSYGTSGSTKFSFFGDVVGQNSVTETTTNMTRANSFSQRAFLVRAIRTKIEFPASTITTATAANAQSATQLGMTHDVANSASLFRWTIQDKEYLKVAEPLLYMPFGAGITDSSVAMTQATAALQTMGYGTISPRKDDVFVLDPPQLIEAEVTFNISIEYNAAVAVTTAGTISVFLDGILFRPVQ